jgi:hypothetical protein
LMAGAAFFLTELSKIPYDVSLIKTAVFAVL